MLFYIEKMKRAVELDDELVKYYKEYCRVRQAPFVMALVSKYNHLPTEKEISDSELSSFCNKVMLGELRAVSLLPAFAEAIEKKSDEIFQKGKIVDIPLEDKNLNR